MQFYHHRACLFVGKILFLNSCKSHRKIWILLHCHSETNLSEIGEFLLYFLSVFSQGHSSYSEQRGNTDEMLTGKPKDIHGRGVEAFLPKSFDCNRPGSWIIRHHGKSNPTTSRNLRFPVWILSKDKSYFSNLRPPTTATHPYHMLSRLLERWELPTSARHSCRIMTLSSTGSRQRSVHFWPLHLPTSYSVWAPRTSAAIRTRLCKQICDMVLHCEADFRGIGSFILV